MDCKHELVEIADGIDDRGKYLKVSRCIKCDVLMVEGSKKGQGVA